MLMKISGEHNGYAFIKTKIGEVIIKIMPYYIPREVVFARVQNGYRIVIIDVNAGELVFVYETDEKYITSYEIKKNHRIHILFKYGD